MVVKLPSNKMFRLLPDSEKVSDKNLAVRLQNLEVWRVTGIRLLRRIGDIEGIADVGNVVFKDTETTLDIFMPIGDTLTDVTFDLAQNFKKHCGITDNIHGQLVSMILTKPISRINKYLESYDLDLPTGAPNRQFPPDEIFEQFESLSINEVPTTESGQHVAATEDIDKIVYANPSQSKSALRAAIPTLDDSIEKVREAATSLNESASFKVFSPNAQRTQKSISFKTFNGSGPGTFVDTESESNSNSPHQSRDSGKCNDSSFIADVSDLSSTVPEVQTHVRTNWKPSHSVLRSENATRLSGGSGNEENSVQALHLKHIGLLGEAFVCLNSHTCLDVH
jgi:hypothetical protein